MTLDVVRNRLNYQLASLSLLLFLAGLSASLFSFQPLFRPSFQMFVRAILAAIVLLAIRFSNCLIRKRLNKEKRARTFEPKLPPKEAIGKALLAAGGEESLLRGFLFAPILTLSFFASTASAYVINGFLSFILYSRRDYWAVDRMIEGTIMAMLYQQYRSLFLLFTARLISELIWILFSQNILDYLTPFSLKRFK